MFTVIAISLLGLAALRADGSLFGTSHLPAHPGHRLSARRLTAL